MPDAPGRRPARDVPPWRVTLEDEPTEAMRRDILEPVVAYNQAAVGPGRFGLLAVTVRDASGRVVGGLWGRAEYEFLFVELLALGPARGVDRVGR